MCYESSDTIWAQTSVPSGIAPIFFPGLSHGELLGICRVSHGALWWLVSQAPFRVCWTKRVNEELFHHFHHWLSQVASNEHLLCTFIFLGCHSLFKE